MPTPDVNTVFKVQPDPACKHLVFQYCVSFDTTQTPALLRSRESRHVLPARYKTLAPPGAAPRRAGMPGLADDTILEVLAGTHTYTAALTAYSDSEAGVELDAVIRLAHVSRALRAHASDSLCALLGRASRPARYLLVTAPKDSVPFVLLQVLLPWVVEQLPPRGELPPLSLIHI